VVCARLDRLARSTRDLLQIAEILEAKGVNLKVLEQPIDTTTAAGRLFFTILGAFAEFEASPSVQERQREGIDAAKAKGAEQPVPGAARDHRCCDDQAALRSGGGPVGDRPEGGDREVIGV
jgi:DNA invertase Pin-like site-specific DNA recombinase